MSSKPPWPSHLPSLVLVTVMCNSLIVGFSDLHLLALVAEILVSWPLFR